MIEILLVFAAGFLTKLSDHFADDTKRKTCLGHITGIIYGILIAWIIAGYPALAPLGIAVILSVVFTKKIDHPIHFLGMGLFILTIGFLGLPPVDMAALLFFLAGGLIDEKGNDLYDKGEIGGIAGRFFEYRITMEVFTLAYSAVTGLWIVFISMLIFDIGYELSGKLAKLSRL